MNFVDMLHRAQLKKAGFVQEGDWNFIKGDFIVEMYRNTVFVNQVFNDHSERTSYRIPLISTDKNIQQKILQLSEFKRSTADKIMDQQMEEYGV